MTRKERLERIIRKEPVDRPGLSFYEIGGIPTDLDETDPFNVYASDSWRRLIELSEAHTDLIRMAGPLCTERHPDYGKVFTTETYMENGSKFSRETVQAGGRELTSLARRDPDVNTTWTLKHLLEDVDDLDAYLSIPDEIFNCDWSAAPLFEKEELLGDRGIVMVDTADPLCVAASLFSMENYTIIALTEQKRFHALLDKVSKALYHRTEFAAKHFPGHLWRIFGPEYATEPYLPPQLFREYVNPYTGPMVDMIHRHGGFARIHCHGRIASALPAIVEMGADGIDPIEPPGQGDVELRDVAAKYGDQLVLFGNLEVSDIENMDEMAFAATVAESLDAGSQAKGFVLMPSASPYGREIAPRTMRNYETMVRLVAERSSQ